MLNPSKDGFQDFHNNIYLYVFIGIIGIIFLIWLSSFCQLENIQAIF